MVEDPVRLDTSVGRKKPLESCGRARRWMGNLSQVIFAGGIGVWHRFTVAPLHSGAASSVHSSHIAGILMNGMYSFHPSKNENAAWIIGDDSNANTR